MNTDTDQTSASSAETPTADQVREARSAAGLTQAQAAALIYMGARAWRKYESGEAVMHAAFWELFRIKVITH